MRLRSYVRCFEGCLELKLAEKGSCDGCTGMLGRTCLRGLVFFEGLSSMTLILGCLFSLLVAQEIFDCLKDTFGSHKSASTGILVYAPEPERVELTSDIGMTNC